MMRYYKFNNQVFAFDEDQLDIVHPDLIKMTAECSMLGLTGDQVDLMWEQAIHL